MSAAPSTAGNQHGDVPPRTSRRAAATHRVRILLYSDDVATRDAVRLAVGRRPSRDVQVEAWHECATSDAVIEAAARGGFDMFVLDGEATPYGGLGLCRELKHSIYECPPVIVLTGRPQDAWLASWSYADHAVPHPLDPMVMAEAVAKVARGLAGSPASEDVGPVVSGSAAP